MLGSPPWMLTSGSGRRVYLAPILLGFLLSLSQPATPEERQPLPSASAVVGRVELDRGRFLFVSGVGPAENVVVYLENSHVKPPPPLPGPPKMLQRFKRFEPHVLVVTPGTSVDFPNLDPIFHNVFSSYYGDKFDLGLYKPGDSKRVEFKVPAVSWIFCDIHQEMSALVLTLNTPYFAVTDRKGEFAISGVPDGKYSLKVWYDEVSPEELERASRAVEITPTTRRLPLIQLSAKGFVRIPHKNKFGKDYPPPGLDSRYQDIQP